MPVPRHRSRSFREVQRVTSKHRTVIHYRRAKPSMPHCAVCRIELQGISTKGGRSRRTTNRLFGGTLCANCTAKIIELGNRVEQGEIRLDEVGIRQRVFVLQRLSH